MSFKKLPDAPRDVTRELTQAFQLSNFCRDLTKAKVIPGTRRSLGGKPPGCAADNVVREPTGEYGTTKKPAGE